jgi:threonine-phosphate decarboxylase
VEILLSAVLYTGEAEIPGNRGAILKEVKLIDVSSGVSHLGPSNKVKAAVRKAIKKINRGPSTELALVRRLFKSKFGIPPENLLFANSMKELIYLVPAVLKPARVLIAGPALDVYEDAAVSAGAEVSYISAAGEDGFAFDISRIKEHAGNTDLVFLANPNRVSGRLISRKLMLDVLTSKTCGHTHFVIDEALIDFAGPDDCHDDIIHNNITILRTTANYYGVPGLELSCAVSSPEIISAYENKRHWEINLLSIEAARTAYKDSTYSKAIKQYISGEKKTIFRMLRKIDWIRVFETDTNIFLVKIDKDPEEVALKLKRAGLDIRDCGDIAGLDRSFFRISVMKHEYNLKLISVLNSLN